LQSWSDSHEDALTLIFPLNFPIQLASYRLLAGLEGFWYMQYVIWKQTNLHSLCCKPFNSIELAQLHVATEVIEL